MEYPPSAPSTGLVGTGQLIRPGQGGHWSEQPEDPDNRSLIGGKANMCKNHVKWVYRSDSNFSWESDFDIKEDRFFLDEKGTLRLIIEKERGRITVTRGYAWNGCSPKGCFFDLIIGTPDGVVHIKTERPKTYYASMVHDALYQFLRVNSPVSRRQADECFLRLMAESEFSLRYIYWSAVRWFGWLVWRATKAKRQWQGTGEDSEALKSSAEAASAA